MRKSRVTEAQIIRTINEQEAGTATAAACRRYDRTPATFRTPKARYGGMELAVIPPVTVRDEPAAGLPVDAVVPDGIAGSCLAVTRDRRFPNPLLASIPDPRLRGAKPA